MRAQSAKKRAELRERKRLTPEVKPPCEWHEGCHRQATDWNEILLASRGGSRIDPENRMWLCRIHHDYFHAHPKAMHEAGLMPHAVYQGWADVGWMVRGGYIEEPE